VQVTDASRNAVNEGERLAKKQSSEWQGRGLRAEEETSKANWKNETKNTLNKVLLRYNINIAINCPIQSPYHTALHAKTRQSSFLLIDTMTGFRRPACIHYSPGVGNLWHGVALARQAISNGTQKLQVLHIVLLFSHRRYTDLEKKRMLLAH